MHDVRSVANAVLQRAWSRHKAVTNLSLNKILYFLHAAHLHETGRPLISAKIEAWDHGPVFREIYHQFKKFGRDEVRTLATRMEASTGAFVEVSNTLSPDELSFVHRHADELLNLSPGRLVSMSHVRDGPWYAARFGNGAINPGVEITDDLIRGSLKTQPRH